MKMFITLLAHLVIQVHDLVPVLVNHRPPVCGGVQHDLRPLGSFGSQEGDAVLNVVLQRLGVYHVVRVENIRHLGTDPSDFEIFS